MNDLLLEIEEKDTLLLQCHKEQQNLQAQIYEQVRLHNFMYVRRC